MFRSEIRWRSEKEWRRKCRKRFHLILKELISPFCTKMWIVSLFISRQVLPYTRRRPHRENRRSSKFSAQSTGQILILSTGSIKKPPAASSSRRARKRMRNSRNSSRIEVCKKRTLRSWREFPKRRRRESKQRSV